MVGLRQGFGISLLKVRVATTDLITVRTVVLVYPGLIQQNDFPWPGI